MTRRRNGQALAEFALVIPIFLLVLFGLVDLGRIVVAYNALTNATREGARLAVVNQDKASISQRIIGQNPIVTPTIDPNTGITFWEPEPDPNPTQNTPCSTANPPPNNQLPVRAGCIVRIVATTQIRPITPFVGQLVGQLTLSAESQVQVDFRCPNVTITSIATAAACPRQP